MALLEQHVSFWEKGQGTLLWNQMSSVSFSTVIYQKGTWRFLDRSFKNISRSNELQILEDDDFKYDPIIHVEALIGKASIQWTTNTIPKAANAVK
jgi:hypothetical protein